MKAKPITRSAKLVVLFLLPFILLTHAAFSSAQDFTAKTIGDFGNVTVMEVTGNYDGKNPDGSFNSGARQAISREFLRTHKDQHDFLIIFSNFDFQMPDLVSRAFYHPVKNDVYGIGLRIFDNSSLFGSSGKLQGTIDMGNISKLILDPLDPGFGEALSVLSHEQMHRWGVHIRFKDWNGNINEALLGKDKSHWSFLFDSKGSVLYGNQWQDNGDGSFTSIGARRYYSALDLYLMGLYDSSLVPPMLLIENSSIDPGRLPEVGVTITGTARYVTIDDIIGAEGRRLPDPSQSQKDFKAAFILITRPNTFRGDEVYGIESLRNGWIDLFSILTDGQGLMRIASTPKEEVANNPGVTPPPYTPRTPPPNIEDGVKWLVSNQRPDGSWMDLFETTERDTAGVVPVLRNFAFAQESYSMGLQWLNVTGSGNIDYFSRKIEALIHSGQDAATLLSELASWQNSDGGWGSNRAYLSNPTDTSFALRALALGSYQNGRILSRAIEYLKSKQNVDGGWGTEDEGSSIQATANVLSDFNKYRTNYPLDASIAQGVAWLIQRQNPDGGFGNSPSTIYDTALVGLTLKEFDGSREAVGRALNYILNLQSADGSWYGSPYQTAMAVDAIWKATIDPDLSIKSDGITFSPPSVKSLPSNVAINATIWNLGKTDVPQAKVVLYEGAVSEANKVGEQVLSFPGQASVQATFSVTITDGNEHKFYVSIDPENLVKESNESNNTAVKILYPESTYDFGVSQISASPNPVDIFEDVRITSMVTNRGTMNAYNVQVRYYVEDTGGPFDIATATVDIPANSTVTSSITWRATRAGDNLPITVHVDPFNLFEEISKANNKGTTFLTVKSSTEPNLKVAYQDIAITPTPARERGDANISALVRNEGFSPAANIEVNFYKGVPGADGTLLGSQSIPSLNPGENRRVSIEWMNIQDSGEKIIYVRVDPANKIKEIKEDDNDAFVKIKILSLPDLVLSPGSLTFAPPAPKDGDMVSIQVNVQNRGEQEASNVVVRAYEGGTVIGSQTIPLISGNGQAVISLAYNTRGKAGPRQITVIADPDNAILEQSEDNNRVTKTLGVQDANLWLTEPYISPNGDGVKDSTQFFFRLSAARTVKIAVVNQKGRVVRTFSGGEFENTTSGHITWDGLDEDGRVVSDGQYQMAVRDGGGNNLGSLPVVVDNNRSPLTDAIGTKYLLNNNLTCMLPTLYDDFAHYYPFYEESWEWFPDGGGVLFNITNTYIETPEYSPGLYRVSPDGQDIKKIYAWEFGERFKDEYTTYELSPNGEKVAFKFDRFDRNDWAYVLSQLWVWDGERNNLTLLVSHEDGTRIGAIKWSPDGTYIVYREMPSPNWGSRVPDNLSIVRPDGTQKLVIHTEQEDVYYRDDYYFPFEIKWSPDGNKIAFIVDDYSGSLNHRHRIIVCDISGNAEAFSVIESDDDDIWEFEWITSQKIVLTGGNYSKSSLWLLDASGAGNHIKVSDNVYSEWYARYEPSYVISPDRRSLAFYEKGEDRWLIKLSDEFGNVITIHESLSFTELPFYFGDSLFPFREVVWNSEGNRLAVVDYAYKKVGCSGWFDHSGYLVLIDTKTKEKKAFLVQGWDESCTKYQCCWRDSLQWLPNSNLLIAQESDANYAKIFVINSESGERADLKQIDYRKINFDASFLLRVSDSGQITYFDSVNPPSGCYGKGEYDLWAMGSLLNLTAELRVVKNKSAAILKGIAEDLNFEGYKLEYVDARSPSLWNPIAPPSEVPVINDVFTTWVPPYEGSFYVKLTAWDKAGNVAWDRKRVSWGLSSSITNIYKSTDIFSPNNDGIKDTAELHYTVLEPVHLEFHIYDEKNQLIRTFHKSHPAPTVDFISWDGKDNSGRVVPDGKYSIKLFNYEFFVEIDITPPDVGLFLSKIRKTSRPEVDLLGHAVDEKLKYWLVEYGEGENPWHWFEYLKGEDILVKRDIEGDPILDPIGDVAIETYEGDGIEWLVGKKLRITAEDFAGNKRTVVTDFLEESLILNQWDDHFVEEIIPAGLARPGIHSLGGVETFRLPFAEMRVQFWVDRKWVDDRPVTDPASGPFRMEWDNSYLNPLEGFAVRMKAVDLLRQEHYSNVLVTRLLFGIQVSCDALPPVKAENSLLEDLRLLRLQVRSDQDPGYFQWKDYFIYDPSKGDSIPEGDFIPPLPQIQSGMKYQLRMVGEGASGKRYESQPAFYPASCPVTITLSVNYHQTGCGLLSMKAILSTEAKGLTSRQIPKTLSYYVERPEGLQLLGRFDLANETWGSVNIDTSRMAEGSYPVKAILTYLDLEEDLIKEAWGTETLLVDRVLPTGRITYPGKGLMICPATVADPKGNWHGIHVEGIADDNNLLKGYELYYGAGENPVQWVPAYTRRGSESIPITGKGSLKGRIGVWDITHLKGTSYSLMLKVIDSAGNVSCFTTSFSMDQVVDIPVLAANRSLFSPNNDGVSDDVQIQYEIDEYARVDVKVFKLIERQDGFYSLDSTPVRTIASGLVYISGMESISWDGKNDSGVSVPDGLYGIALFATDSCGNTNMRWTPVEVDNTSPTTVITYPGPGDPIGNIVEVKGTADDLHFQSFSLEVGQGDFPGTWISVSSGTNPVMDGILGRWNTFGLQGMWTLRLSVTDAAGNKGIATVGIDLGVRKDLIKSLNASSHLFSPNHDGKLDTVKIDFELTEACDVKIEFFDSTGGLKRTHTRGLPAAGTASFVWDGKDNGGAVVADGIYTVRLTAALSSNPLVTQEESVTVAVDATPPLINLKKPLDQSHHQNDVPVNGTITDKNLTEYSILYTGHSSTVLLDKGGQNRENHTFGVLRELAEGDYLLTVKAKDSGENSAQRSIAFTIDRTPPRTTLDSPKEGEYYGGDRSLVNITGGIVEKNLETYSLRYGSGENPSTWANLVNGGAVPSHPQLFAWKVGKVDGLPDGHYTLSLLAKDKAGQTGEAKVKVIVDNTPPEAAITAPRDGDYVKGATEIKGTAFDQNLEKYTLEIGSGPCTAVVNWTVMKTSTAPVRDGVIAFWSGLPADGHYCLRLTAGDKLGSRSEAKGNVRVDTQPPATPSLSGIIEDRSNIKLAWTGNAEPDFAGYYLFRDGQKINETPIRDTGYVDLRLKEGVYAYTVKAVDHAGNESRSSNEVRVRVDLTGPGARIGSPRDGSKVSGLVDIKGTAYSSEDFKQYRVLIGQGSDPSVWTLIRTSPVPISYGSLVQWDTIGLMEGAYSIKLEAEDLAGNISTHQVAIAVDNTAPGPPVLSSATATGSEVTLLWVANREPDLAGYLLHRNGQIVNAPGMVIGDLRPYLISGTTYLDKGVSDGRFRYYLTAMDQAGNMSDPSNALEVEIDIRSPCATIAEPPDRAKFQEKTLIRAESPDIDIASIQFQFKRSEENSWIDMGGPVTHSPYATFIDPVGLGLTYGHYHMRAVATDRGGKTDPSPPFITVTYTDLVPPEPPKDLKAQTTGSEVTLSWKANIEPDLDGYNLYRSFGNLRRKVNTAILKGETYQDKGLSDGTYTYEITAVDTYGNESKPSNSESAKIYGLYLGQPYTPSAQSAIQIDGYGAAASSSVEIFNETSSGLFSVKVNANPQGNFSLPKLDLVLGENRITAKATDSSGNVSKASDRVVVVYNEPPSAPTGLAASVTDFDVSLTWNPNSEADLAGYNLYRNGEKLNRSSPISSENISASSEEYPPELAFDQDPWTYWMASLRDDFGGSNPARWEIDFPSPELINQVEIEWGSGFDEQGNWNLYAGSNFEIQVWTGYAWITQATVNWNYSNRNAFDFKPSYRTDKIRIFITDTTDPDYNTRQVRISEVRIFKDHLITETSYLDANLQNGFYGYKVTAVDYYGFESLPSEEVRTGVGDVTPPSPPQNLTATASDADILLNWDAHSELDLSGYNLYRNALQGWVKINISLITVTTYRDGSLQNGTYTYRVTAVDHNGNESLPSNEAEATVYGEPPQPPTNLRIVSLPGGRALSASWDETGTAASYNLYRSATSGGPYSRVNGSLIIGTSYIDTGLTNGVAYYYVVVAMDSFRNESAHSNEAMGIPSDAIPPERPELFFPTLPGAPITLYKDGTDLSGMAEPGSGVELFKDGVPVGKAIALQGDVARDFSFYGDGEASLSPDGKTLAYADYYGNLWLRSLAASTTKMIEQGHSPLWSPDGNKIAYRFRDNKGNNHIGIYDVETSSSFSLTDDMEVSEGSPSWTSDGKRIAFVSNRGGSQEVWMKDLVTESLAQVTQDAHASNPKISPDGRKLTYFEGNVLYLVDLLRGTKLQLDDQTDGHSLDWPPDSSRLTFKSYRNGNADIYVHNVDTQNQNQVAGSVLDEFKPVWSPDGKNLLYGRSETDGSVSLWVTSTRAQGEERLLQQSLYRLDDLFWTKSGGIALIDRNQGLFRTLHLKGYFSFKDVLLNPGENLFHAIARDPSGNSSSPSEEISVIFDTALIPDLEIRGDDISIHPTYPISGETAVISTTVRNRGRTGIKDVEAVIYLSDSAGGLEWLRSERIPWVASHSEAFITIPLDTKGRAGTYAVIAIVDPQDRIHEFSELNNFAVREFSIAKEEGVSMTTTLDADRYRSGEEVKIQVQLKNSGFARDVVVEVWIETQNGETVALLDTVGIRLPYASEKIYHLIWNTGFTYAGSYRVCAVLKGSPEALAENRVPFLILPEIDIVSTLATDKMNYGSNENVMVSLNVTNRGQNYILPQIEVKVRIVNPGNQDLLNEDKKVTNILPGVTAALNTMWNTGIHSPGDYQAAVEIFLDGQRMINQSTGFKINASVILTGEIIVTPSVVLLGNTIQANYFLQSQGNTDINGLGVKVSVVDPETQAMMDTYEETVNLFMSHSHTGQAIFSTQRYQLKTYVLYLDSSYQGSQKRLASISFIVKDGTPPVVSILSPAPHSYFNSTVHIAAIATDNASGIDRVEYQIDANSWRLLPVADPSHGRYSASWAPTPSDEGVRAIRFRAIDRAGNISAPVFTTFTFDLTPPLPPIILSPPNQSNVATEIVDIDGLSEPGATVEMAFGTLLKTGADSISGRFNFRGVKLLPGKNIFTFKASDLAGNLSIQTEYSIYLAGLCSIHAIAGPGGTIHPSGEVTANRGSDQTFTIMANSGFRILDVKVDGRSIGPLTNYTFTKVDGDHQIEASFAINQYILTAIAGPNGTISPSGSVIVNEGDSQTFTITPHRGYKIKTIFVNGISIGTANTHTFINVTADHRIEAHFEPAIEVTKTIPDIIRLLVWLNYPWQSGQNCPNRTLIERALGEAGANYHIVLNKKDFQAEVGNPYYTDFVILGDHHPIEDHFADMLRGQVQSGKGLISSMFNRQNLDNEVFGFKFSGHLSGRNYPVELLESEISDPGIFQSSGRALRISALNPAENIGWILEETKKRTFKYPAIIKRQYGEGKVLFFAFDLGLSSTNYVPFAALLGNSLDYIHKPLDPASIHPGDFIPIEIKVKSSGGAFDLKVIESYPPKFKLYDPATGEWITRNPWVISMSIEPDETKTILYYALTPDRPDKYNLETEVGYMESGSYNFYQDLSIDIVVK